MEATIYKSTGSWYAAKTFSGETYQCRIKGKMKLDEEITSTNPVAVGDKVVIVPEEEDSKIASIVDILPRRNYIVRSSPHRTGQQHIVAANMDQAAMLATITEPRTSQGFIDRFLVTAAAYHIPAFLIFNKSDIYKEKDLRKFQELKDMYEKIGYEILLISAEKAEGINIVEEHLQGKVSLLTGHSGTGKSTLLNLIMPGLQQKTAKVSGWSGKGTHTTTYAEMFDLPQSGSIIDTPGIREWGIVDMEKAELAHYFLEMQPYVPQCQFNNCLHINEPGCAVLEAVYKGEIAEDRYISYRKILDSMEAEKY